jgi:hypothetical protein
MTKRRCAAGVRNLTCFNGGEARIMQQGALFALIDLSSSFDLEVKRHVAAALFNMTCCAEVRHEMAECGVVAVLTSMVEGVDAPGVLADASGSCTRVCKGGGWRRGGLGKGGGLSNDGGGGTGPTNTHPHHQQHNGGRAWVLLGGGRWLDVVLARVWARTRKGAGSGNCSDVRCMLMCAVHVLARWQLVGGVMRVSAACVCVLLCAKTGGSESRDRGW